MCGVFFVFYEKIYIWIIDGERKGKKKRRKGGVWGEGGKDEKGGLTKVGIKDFEN